MKSVVRIFALFVAFAGLASASLTSANTQARTMQNSLITTDPGPTINLPVPVPCQSVGACYAPTTAVR